MSDVESKIVALEKVPEALRKTVTRAAAILEETDAGTVAATMSWHDKGQGDVGDIVPTVTVTVRRLTDADE